MKKILFGLLVSSMIFGSSLFTDAAAFTNIVTIERGSTMNYEALLSQAYALAGQYPTLLTIHELGKSTDGKSIVEIVFTENADQSVDYEKKHLAVVAGIHGRESISSVVSLETLELYCQAYNGRSDLGFNFNVKTLASKTVLHLLLCANPDGMDISLSGLTNIVNKSRVSGISTNYANWKANINGVDINRNFSSIYYDKALGKWVDYFLWDGVQQKAYLFSDRPSHEYFGGYKPFSEIETRLVKAFYEGFSPRLSLEVHSRGEIVYYDQPLEDAAYKAWAKKIAYGIKAINGYKPQDGQLSVADYKLVLRDGAAGYSSDWVATEYKIPCVTVELADSRSTYPLKVDEYTAALHEFKNVPLYMLSESLFAPYHDYKVYVDDLLYHDFSEKWYADLMAQRLGGMVVSYDGVPATALIDTKKAVPLYLNGVEVPYKDEMEGKVFVSQETLKTMAPLRYVAETIGLSVYYSEKTNTVNVTDSLKIVTFPMDSKVVRVDGVAADLQEETRMINGMCYVELVALVEPFGYEVDWQEEAGHVSVATAVQSTDAQPEAEVTQLPFDEVYRQ